MARQTQRSSTKSAPEKAPAQKLPSAFQLWFEDAWNGWLKHVAGILILGVGFALYKLDLLNEHLAALLLALGISFGALVVALLPARDHAKSASHRNLVYALCAIWAVCAGYPIVFGIFPGKVLASGQLADEGAQITLQAPDGGKEMYVTGKLKGGSGDINATYKLVASWQGGGETIEGALSRATAHVRVGRRGSGTSVTEHNEEKHYVGRTNGPVMLKLEQKDESLDKDFLVELRSAPIPPLWILVASSLVFVWALWLDRVIDPKGRTSLGVSVAISLVFALYYGFNQAHPHRVIAPAVGSAFLAIIAGGIGGWIIAKLVQKLTPEKKRRARA